MTRNLDSIGKFAAKVEKKVDFQSNDEDNLELRSDDDDEFMRDEDFNLTGTNQNLSILKKNTHNDTGYPVLRSMESFNLTVEDDLKDLA